MASRIIVALFVSLAGCSLCVISSAMERTSSETLGLEPNDRRAELLGTWSGYYLFKQINGACLDVTIPKRRVWELTFIAGKDGDVLFDSEIAAASIDLGDGKSVDVPAIKAKGKVASFVGSELVLETVAAINGKTCYTVRIVSLLGYSAIQGTWQVSNPAMCPPPTTLIPVCGPDAIADGLALYKTS